MWFALALPVLTARRKDLGLGRVEAGRLGGFGDGGAVWCVGRPRRKAAECGLRSGVDDWTRENGVVGRACGVERWFGLGCDGGRGRRKKIELFRVDGLGDT